MGDKITEINQGPSSVEQKIPPRIFLQAGLAVNSGANIDCWFEIHLTKAFVNRLRHLTKLLLRERLWSVEDSCSLSWSHLSHESMSWIESMSISESGIDFKAEFIQQFSDSNARKDGSVHSYSRPGARGSMKASLPFDSSEDHLYGEDGTPYDHLYQEDRRPHDYLLTTADDAHTSLPFKFDVRRQYAFRDFYQKVAVHLAEQQQSPLRLTRWDFDRLRIAEIDRLR